MTRSPSYSDDEGTYIAQAWAVQNWHTLAHYTYWYDHPPLGWLLLSLWTWATRAFSRSTTAVAAGREFVLISQTLSAALLYVLSRRLSLLRGSSAVAVLLFSLSPLAIFFHRMVLLDNIALPFLLTAFILALCPSRRLSTQAGSAVCFAAAVLIKETNLILLPSLAWQLWRSFDPRTRSFSLALSGSLFPLVMLVDHLIEDHGFDPEARTSTEIELQCRGSDVGAHYLGSLEAKT